MWTVLTVWIWPVIQANLSWKMWRQNVSRHLVHHAHRHTSFRHNCWPTQTNKCPGIETKHKQNVSVSWLLMLRCQLAPTKQSINCSSESTVDLLWRYKSKPLFLFHLLCRFTNKQRNIKIDFLKVLVAEWNKMLETEEDGFGDEKTRGYFPPCGDLLWTWSSLRKCKAPTWGFYARIVISLQQ